MRESPYPHYPQPAQWSDSHWHVMRRWLRRQGSVVATTGPDKGTWTHATGRLVRGSNWRAVREGRNGERLRLVAPCVVGAGTDTDKGTSFGRAEREALIRRQRGTVVRVVRLTPAELAQLATVKAEHAKRATETAEWLALHGEPFE